MIHTSSGPQGCAFSKGLKRRNKAQISGLALNPSPNCQTVREPRNSLLPPRYTATVHLPVHLPGCRKTATVFHTPQKKLFIFVFLCSYIVFFFVFFCFLVLQYRVFFCFFLFFSVFFRFFLFFFVCQGCFFLFFFVFFCCLGSEKNEKKLFFFVFFAPKKRKKTVFLVRESLQTQTHNPKNPVTHNLNPNASLFGGTFQATSLVSGGGFRVEDRNPEPET